MKKRAPLLFAVLLTFAVSGFAATVRGRVRLVDKSGADFPLLREIPGKNVVRLFERINNSDVTCHVLLVSGQSLQTLEIDSDDPCVTRPLFARFEMTKLPAGWQQTPLPTDLPRCSGATCNFTVVVERPANPPVADRTANLDAGTRAVDPATSLFYLQESILGDDLAFTTKAMEYLEKNGRQMEVPQLLEVKDLAKLNVSERTRFKLLVRAANGKRAADEPVDALKLYSAAQGIYPRNREVAMLAVAAVRDATGETNPIELAMAINEDPELRESFGAVLENWDQRGKPKVHTKDGKVTTAAVRFAVRNKAKIE